MGDRDMGGMRRAGDGDGGTVSRSIRLSPLADAVIDRLLAIRTAAASAAGEQTPTRGGIVEDAIFASRDAWIVSADALGAWGVEVGRTALRRDPGVSPGRP